ncbi:MAG TPA: nitrogen regulatory IIA protein [Agriterribacter sp.]|uniref:nitrogen regulatory IIA protein n=1 Tax=Agriterribacter sp. TaxID=2821509 RepID=UPI002BBB22E1|nr:nitrogen regulatory IIA protein [Agriterribacter sp.]HRQ18503.1 nitrogen regulatory IIA protein [Agriterribacter sp.]
MEKLRVRLEAWLSKWGSRWQALPVGKQQKYILLLFIFYLLLSIGVILKVWYDLLQPGQRITMEHIENPLLLKKDSGTSVQDSISKILKNKMYGPKKQKSKCTG